MYKTRNGAATAPTVTTAGTDGSLTAPRVVTFVNTYVRPCFVMNGTGGGRAVKVKVNAPASNDFDNDSDDDGPGYFTIADGETKDVSAGGLINVSTVSFVTLNGADDLDNVAVVGWSP